MNNSALNDNERDQLTDLLATLIRFPSPDPPGNEAEIAPFLANYLTDLGLDVETDAFAPDRINVIARLRGKAAGPALVFSAHMDTMPIGDSAWVHDPFGAEIINNQQDGARLYGRGAADMKSGLAAMVVAAAKIKHADIPLNGDLVLAFSAGESAGCIGAKRMIETDCLADAKWLLVSEPSSLQVLTAETGALWLNVTAHGETGHASAGGGDSTISRLMDFLERLKAHKISDAAHPLLGAASVAVNGLMAGSAPNVSPDRAQATLDIRTLPGQDSQQVIDQLLALAGDEFTIEVIDDKPPVETPVDDPFVATCLNAVIGACGQAAAPGGVHYFSDSNVLVPALKIPRVIIGPGELGMSGSQDEWVALDAVADAAAIYAKIASEVLAG
jgi:succinyl-diaminopimelate desuccinylase